MLPFLLHTLLLIDYIMKACFIQFIQFISFILILTISLICFKQEIEKNLEEYSITYLSIDQQKCSGIKKAKTFIYN